MPGSFPAAPPILTGDLLTISRFLQSPELIRRRLRDYKDLRFVSDQLLTGRFRSQGGAVLYETAEPFISDRTVESVAPGATYPYANLPVGTASIAAIQKWGQKVLLTDEEILRNAYAGSAVDRVLRKVVNSIISQVDGLAMSAIASAVTQTFPVATAWTAASPTILRDVLRSKAIPFALNLGYNPDTLAVNDAQYAYMMTDVALSNTWRRETTDNPVYTGQVQNVAGLNIVVSPAITTGNCYVLDSTQFGGMADEVDGAPGYAVSDLGVQIKAIRDDEADSWDMQGRRKTVPIIQEPGAAVKLTGLGV